VAVVADPDAVRFIAENGGRVWVYADRAGLKHVRTMAPEEASLQFEEVEGDGFLLFVESDLVQPETWWVELRHFPHRHIDVLWDGHQPGSSVGPPSGNVW
jgi:hypothetical protein